MNEIFSEQQNNTRLWQLELNDMLLANIPDVAQSSQEDQDLPLLPGNIVLFPALDCASALITGVNKNGGFSMIPISPYQYPAMDFELRLPVSGYVLETWNYRIFAKDDVGEMVPIDRIPADDFTLAQNHYHYVFDARQFSSKATGKSQKMFTDAEEKDLMRYVEEQAEVFPDDVFIVLDHSADPLSGMLIEDAGDEIGMSIFGAREPVSEETDADDIFDFPGGDTEYRWERNAAASKKTDDPFDDLL